MNARALALLAVLAALRSSTAPAVAPQVGGGYEAFWLRDCAYMLDGSRASGALPSGK